MPRFRLSTDTFIAPDFLKAGSIIEYSGPLGPHFDPLDEEGEALLAQYYRSNPHAAIGPIESLRVVGGQPGEVAQPAATLIEAPKVEDRAFGIGNVVQPGRATPGLTEGGKALDVAKR